MPAEGMVVIKRDDVIKALKKVMDPELGVDIWNLGLVYEVKIEDETVEIKMTFTSPMCPLAPLIIEGVKEEVSAVKDVKDVKVEITFDPMWTPDRISEDVRATLGI